jgi:hypothetical protein
MSDSITDAAPLSREVEQLRMERDELKKICRIENAETLRLLREVERFRYALPELINCSQGVPMTCNWHQHGWGACCIRRLAAVRHGLLPATTQPAEAEDGA